jgi:hypothetical protein
VSTLTDRYVWAVVRLLPEAQRAEIDRELRELVAEMSDARLADGAPPVSAGTDTAHTADAERDVLTQLGDPSLLAARYVERPRHLVGPDVFPEYVRILRLVGSIAIPIVAALAALAALLEDDPSFWFVLGRTLLGAYGATVLVAFWVTVVYAFADKWKHETAWTPDLLVAEPPASSSQELSVVEGASTLVVTVLAATALVWQQVWPPLDDPSGQGVPVLDPDIWNGAAQAMLALLAASFAVNLVVLIRRRWTYALAAINATVNAAFLVVVAWLALDERLLNTEFLAVLTERAGWDEVPTINPWIIVVGVGAIEVWDAVEALLAARRDAARQKTRSLD